MPASPRVEARTEQAVGNPGAASYQTAKDVVAGASTLSAAVETGHFLDGFSDEDKKEVRRVLAAVPAGVDRAFMASLHAALNENRKVRFNWEEHRELEIRARGVDGRRHVRAHAPHASSQPTAGLNPGPRLAARPRAAHLVSAPEIRAQRLQ